MNLIFVFSLLFTTNSLVGFASCANFRNCTITRYEQVIAPTSDPDLDSTDALGWRLAFDNPTLLVTARNYDSGVVADVGTAFVFMINLAGDAFYEVSKLMAPDAAEDDHFGYSGDVSGTNIAIGSVEDDDVQDRSGSVHIFYEQSSETWVHLQKLTPAVVSNAAFFGESVSLQGQTLIIGAHRHKDPIDDIAEQGGVWVFYEATLNVWTETDYILASDACFACRFGIQVAFDGPNAVVGSDNYPGGGSVYFLQETVAGQEFIIVDMIQPTDLDTGDKFGGEAIDISGQTAVVSARYQHLDAVIDVGAVYVFIEVSNGNWEQSAKFVPPAESVVSSYGFGMDVAIDGQDILVGTANEPSTEIDKYHRGAAFLYHEVTTGTGDWEFIEKISAINPGTASTKAGNSVALQGDVLVLGGSNTALETYVQVITAWSNDCCPVPGWTNVPACDVEILECSSSPCSNGGTCVESTPPTYECLCPEALFAGDICEVDIGCIDGHGCLNGATCVADGINPYTCECALGWTGALCGSNVDECASSPCLHGGACTEELMPGDFSCDCTAASGFEGDVCADDTDDCISSPCYNEGICSDSGTNAFMCNCTDTGYEGSLCEEDVNDCVSSPCLNDGICTDRGNKLFECDCTETRFSGTICELDDCISSPCQNMGTCTALQKNKGGYTCACEPGYAGLNCEQDEDDCLSSPCFNGGDCTDTGFQTYACNCTDRWLGDQCSDSICISDPCLNGGTCSSTKKKLCSCMSGYSGDVCESDTDDCLSLPCANAGICMDAGTNEYECLCNGTGFVGLTCEDAGPCASMPCQNGETCSNSYDTPGAYDCTAEKEGRDCGRFSDGSCATTDGETSIYVVEIAFVSLENSNDTVEQFAADLPEILADSVGGKPLEWTVTDIDETNSDIYIQVEWETAEVVEQSDIEERIAVSEVATRTNDLRVDAVLVGNEEPSDDNESSNDNAGALLIIMIVLAVVAIIAAILYAIWRNQQKKSHIVKDLTLPA